MSLLGRLFGRHQSRPFEQWERAMTAKIPQPLQDSRRYLEGSDYQLPKDEAEDDRLDFQHHALFHAIGTHYVAPISPPLRLVLDVGTGTGIWARDIACLHPAAMVIGIDLSAASFKQSLPDNCLLRV